MPTTKPQRRERGFRLETPEPPAAQKAHALVNGNDSADTTLAPDLLRGAEAIARYLGWPLRVTRPALVQKHIPTTRCGLLYVASKRWLRAHFQGEETAESEAPPKEGGAISRATAGSSTGGHSAGHASRSTRSGQSCRSCTSSTTATRTGVPRDLHASAWLLAVNSHYEAASMATRVARADGVTAYRKTLHRCKDRGWLTVSETDPHTEAHR